MTGYKIEIEGLEEMQEKLRKFPELFEREMGIAMGQAVVVVEGNVKVNTPVNTGILRASIGSEVRHPMGGTVQGVVGTSMMDEVYPLVMETGAKPHYPPPKNLERWVHLRMGVPVEDAPKVARAVAAGIARRGIKGRFYMKAGLEKSLDMVKGLFVAGFKRMMEKL